MKSHTTQCSTSPARARHRLSRTAITPGEALYLCLCMSLWRIASHTVMLASSVRCTLMMSRINTIEVSSRDAQIAYHQRHKAHCSSSQRYNGKRHIEVRVYMRRHRQEYRPWNN